MREENLRIDYNVDVLIDKALAQSRTKTEACKKLGISMKTLLKYIKNKEYERKNNTFAYVPSNVPSNIR